MSTDQPQRARNRTVGCKMTESEYEKLTAVAEGDGMTLGADSGRRRSAFRGESDHDSWLIPISIPARKRSPFLWQADQ
jgi:hypothetical protein